MDVTQVLCSSHIHLREVLEAQAQAKNSTRDRREVFLSGRLLEAYSSSLSPPPELLPHTWASLSTPAFEAGSQPPQGIAVAGPLALSVHVTCDTNRVQATGSGTER